MIVRCELTKAVLEALLARELNMSVLNISKLDNWKCVPELVSYWCVTFGGRLLSRERYGAAVRRLCARYTLSKKATIIDQSLHERLFRE